MNQALRHRGPDSEGSFETNRVGLAMRRLAIIDLDGGSQPMADATRKAWIVFNGEIYNHLELRARLVSKGRQFKTRSDTEVLLQMYSEFGIDMLRSLRGMFAFCIFDAGRNTVLLARDRFGEKPLFYTVDGSGLRFASELQALMQDPSIDRVLNPEALAYYLRMGFVPEPLTLFRKVFSLPPGYYLEMGLDNSDREIVPRPYYQPDYTADPALANDDLGVKKVRDAVLQAISLQTRADVSLGAFLSGGVDSGTVVGALARVLGAELDAFTVQFPDCQYDESSIAAAQARVSGVRHHVRQMPPAGFSEADFWSILRHVGEPFCDSSAIPTSFVSSFARETVTVALSGDGGDEMFAGYDTFRWLQSIDRVAAAPRWLLHSLATVCASSLTSFWPEGVRNRIRKVAKGVEVAALPDATRFLAVEQMMNPSEVRALVSDSVQESLSLPVENHMTEERACAQHWTPLRRAMDWRIRHSLTRNMLVKVDRMSMRHSLEVRSPFLDPDLAELAGHLPDSQLIRHGRGKSILRRAARELLADEVLLAPKRGFALPLHRFAGAEFFQLANRLLETDTPVRRLFREESLRALFRFGNEFKYGDARRSVFRATHQMWLMMQLLGWALEFKVKV
jgi:asparagine synthase (glutamine-hydrolysing)